MGMCTFSLALICPTTFRSTCGLCSVVMCTVAYGSFTAVLIIVAMLLCFQDALFSGKAEFNCLSVSLTAHFLLSSVWHSAATAALSEARSRFAAATAVSVDDIIPGRQPTTCALRFLPAFAAAGRACGLRLPPPRMFLAGTMPFSAQKA